MAIQWLFCWHVPHNSTANDQNFPHTISILAMATPLPIDCSNCCIKQLDCNISSHIKGACNACHVNGLECLSPPPTNLLHGLLTTQILARNQKKLESYCMFIPNPTYSRFDSNCRETPTYTHRKRTQNCASKTLAARGLEELFFQLCCCVSFRLWQELDFGFI